MTDAGSLLIAQVCPRPLDDLGDVARHVRLLSAGLAAAGHRVLVIAPSRDRAALRDARHLIATEPSQLVPAPGDPARHVALGEATASRRTTRREATFPVDVGRALEELFDALDVDLCHLHDPLPPSLPAIALKVSGALNVATFHTSPSRTLAAPITRRMREQRYGRLDARLATSLVVAHEIEGVLGGSVAVVAPGADQAGDADRPAGASSSDQPLRIAYVEQEERAAMRTVQRALRQLPDDLAWQARIVTGREAPASAPLTPAQQERVTYVDRSDPAAETEALTWADAALFASDGAAPTPAGVRRAIAAGAVPVVSGVASYVEVIGADERGIAFDVRQPAGIAAALTGLHRDPERRHRLQAAATALRDAQRPERIVAETLTAYRRLLARRHDPRIPTSLERRLADRPTIDVDLHMHTDHSHDCATPVEVLLQTARERGLGAIAVTDHNLVSGALEAAELADRYGIKVIVGEEVKTASQGEVIGLFIDELIPRGMTLQETIAEIRRQGGVVYVPHPFDRMHAVPDYEHLLDVLDDVDAIEIFNPRVAVGAFNDEARRFAQKYRLAMGAGSDAHVAQGLGSVRIRMPDFDGPEEFLAALRMGEIQPTPASLVYVQALKFLETKATPPAARRARAARRVRRAERRV